jgi:hypothetical protein
MLPGAGEPPATTAEKLAEMLLRGERDSLAIDASANLPL